MLSMKRIFCLIIFSSFLSVCNAQLLTWTPDFSLDNDNLTITVDATKGNQGLMNFSGNLKICVVRNFDVNAMTGSVIFQNSCTWSENLTAATITTAGLTQSINLQPGVYWIYLNRRTGSRTLELRG